MRIIPTIGRHRGEGKDQVDKKMPVDHRRSWHVGTTATPDAPARNIFGRNAKRRPSVGRRHRTWHFPRSSRHSSHQAGYQKSSPEENAYQNSPREEENEELVCEAVATKEQRKTFKQSPKSLAEDDRDKRDGKENWFKRARRRTTRIFKAIEDFLFPGCNLRLTHHTCHGARITQVRGGVLLRSCLTAEEHRARVQEICASVKNLYGEEGLRVVGLEYRFCPCPEHGGGKPTIDNDDQPKEPEDNAIPCEETVTTAPEEEDARVEDEAILSKEIDSKQSEEGENNQSQKADDGTEASSNHTVPPQHLCHRCSTQLYHIETNTRINEENRKSFIADGDMYDVVGRLCQENAHEIMQRRYYLQWVTVCTPEEDDHHPLKRNSHEPIRALVNPEHPLVSADNPGDVPIERLQHFAERPTLLIITGKGKVRAGIFSRYHMLVSGIETSSAIPLIQEARFRELNVVVVDPNCHGDQMGMFTFEKSMAKLFHFWERAPASDEDERGDAVDSQQSQTLQPFTNRDLYILSHSASGSQLARYLMEKSEHYLPHIRAIAFTDSTHNIQWARQREKHDLARLLESPACVYFRSASVEKDANWYKHRAGEEAPRDAFWKHRFGNIRTCWAGTKEHALTNWFAHPFIWEHFDNIMNGAKRETDAGDTELYKEEEVEPSR